MLAPWKKSKANLDSILKSRDITLSRNVCIVKVMVFTIAMYLLSLVAPRQAWSHSTLEGPGLAAPLWPCLRTALSLQEDSVSAGRGYILSSLILDLLPVPPFVSPSSLSSFNYSPACL